MVLIISIFAVTFEACCDMLVIVYSGSENMQEIMSRHFGNGQRNYDNNRRGCAK